MAWKIRISEFAAKQIKKLDKTIARKNLKYLKEKIAVSKSPRLLGKSLLYEQSGLWRYRVGDYRLICEMKDRELTILVIRMAHRKNIYEQK